jgi:hypothetical protein
MLAWAESCPNMIGTSKIPSGWQLVQGSPSNSNVFEGATWNLSFKGIGCSYGQFLSNSFTLVSLNPNVAQPEGGSWQIIKNYYQTYGVCKTNQILACPFNYIN